MDEALESDLQILAKTKGRPVASLVREAISEYVQKQRGRAGSKLSFVGVGRSGRRSTAERHEELLWSDLAVHPDSAAGAGKSDKRSRHHRSRARVKT